MESHYRIDRAHRFPHSLSMLGWALNEEESIAEYIERAGELLASVADDYELILLDDGSTDRTWQIACEMAVSRPWLRPYQNDGNRGPGYSTKRAVELSSKDYLFWQTVDWAYDVTGLLENLDYLQHYDVLQGVRANALTLGKALQHRSDNSWKAFISTVNYRLIRLLFRLPISDYQNVTVYPRRLIQSCVLESESSFTNPECLLKTWWKGASFLEIPVPFLKREQGEAKGTKFRQVWMAIRDILYWWSRWVLLRRRNDFGRGTVVGWTGATIPVPAMTPKPAVVADHEEVETRKAA